MTFVNLNGKIFHTVEELQNDNDFVSLDSKTQQLLMSSLTGQQPEVQTTNIVPVSVSPRQFRTALVLSGFSLSDIDSFIANLPSPQKELAKIAWEYSTEIHRDNDLLTQMAPMLGFTSEQLDQLFILASTL
jgi:hypothetical protein